MAGNESTDMSWLDPPDPPTEDGPRDRAEGGSSGGPARVSARLAVVAAAVAAIAGVGVGMELGRGTQALGVEAEPTARVGCDLLRQVPGDFMDGAPGGGGGTDADGDEVYLAGQFRMWAAFSLFEVAAQLDEDGQRYDELVTMLPMEFDDQHTAGVEACEKAGL